MSTLGPCDTLGYVMTARRFLAPLAWSALIAWFSSDRWGAGATSPLLEPWLRALAPWAAPEQIAALHWLARKAGHVGEYTVLALLWRRALAPGGWRAPLLLAVLTAALDEAHQATTLTREGSVADVLLDGAAAAGEMIRARDPAERGSSRPPPAVGRRRGRHRAPGDRRRGRRASRLALGVGARGVARPLGVATGARPRVNDLPAWRQGDLPHAPAYNPVNLVRVIGPGAILLGLSLGAGDWLLGPAIAAAYGPSLLWICTLSILFQGVLNTEMARYTLATGEPVFTGSPVARV